MSGCAGFSGRLRTKLLGVEIPEPGEFIGGDWTDRKAEGLPRLVRFHPGETLEKPCVFPQTVTDGRISDWEEGCFKGQS
ncbi:MAG: hypothetical protein JWM59_1037 [Verrucomicrobiales bacterium]|nr:hypothetical protein [Verrucomicrobiales bacterium]